MYRKPFLKWAGGKFRLLDRILPMLPKGKRLVEVFAGSAVLYVNSPCEKALICDSNPDLIRLYNSLQSDGEAFINFCAAYFTPENNSKEAFLRLRGAFNREKDAARRGALLLYLNRHGFNGLIRYNGRGEFNVPFGRYAKPYFPWREMRDFYEKCRSTETEFRAQPYAQSFAACEDGDVLYCDPPYTPLSATASFTMYSGRSFGMRDQAELARLARQHAAQGVPVLISNHDTEAIRELYEGARIISFPVQRRISCKGSERRPAQELLALFS